MLTTINWNLTRDEASENREEFRLIWFGPKKDHGSSGKSIETLLLNFNSTTEFFTDVVLCENFIKTAKDELLVLIIHDEYVEKYLLRMAELRFIRAIFIFSEKKTNAMHHPCQHPKVIETFTNKRQLFSSIKQTLRMLEKQTYAFSLFNQHQKTAKDISRESASFLWHQLLIHVLRQMTNDENAKIDMLNSCAQYYQFNKVELQNIELFRRTYSAENAIHWYTANSFVYRLLNKVLRTENIELIYVFRYFIIDLCAQLEHRRLKLNKNETLLVYRGQQIPNEEFHTLKENIGKLISPNGFLSTSRDKKISIVYAGTSSKDTTAVLFEIEVDSSSQSVIFADIEKISVFPQEREILFSIGSTFKIDLIEFKKDLSLWVIRLKSIDASERVEEYLKVAKNEMKDVSPMIYFGSLLLHELGQIEHAQKYFNFLLKTLPATHPDIAGLYTGLGHLYMKRNEHYLALEQYKKAYDIRLDRLSVLNPRIAASLRNIAHAHRAMGNNDQALAFLREAKHINERNYSVDHLNVAMTFEDIGLNYQDKNDFPTALFWFKEALEIFQRILPLQHPQIAECLGRIGNIFKCMHEYDNALTYLHQELDMDELCLPSDHLDVINDLTRVVDIYKLMEAYEQGLKFCQNKLIVYENLLNERHPRSLNTRINMITLYLKANQIDDALALCKHTLSIATKTVPMDVLNIVNCLDYMNDIYQIKEDLRQCLDCRQQQLEILKSIHPSNDDKVAWTLECIGNIHYSLGNYKASLDRFEESVSLYRMNSPQEDDIVYLVEEKINLTKRKLSFETKPREWQPIERKSKSRPNTRIRSGNDSRSSTCIYSSD